MRTTSNYRLTQYDGTDSPKWLEPSASASQTPENSSAGSYTRDMRVIDKALNDIKTLANSALSSIATINTKIAGFIQVSTEWILPGSKVGTGEVNGLSTANYKNDSVTGAKIAHGDNGVLEENIKDRAVTGIKIAQNTIIGGANGNLAEDTVDTVNLTAAAISTMGVPTGTIAMWPKSSAPVGWALCNGSPLIPGTHDALIAVLGGATATPDLRGRMPLGYDGAQSTGRVDSLTSEQKALGGFGGADTIILTTNKMPSHTHNIAAHTHYETLDHYHTVPTHTHALRVRNDTTMESNADNGSVRLVNGAAAGSSNGVQRNFSSTLANEALYISEKNAFNTKDKKTGTDDTNSDLSGHSMKALVTDSEGSGEAHSNMPPFYTLNFIIKL